MTETRPFLDFKAIKARASISSILDRYGVKLNRVNQTTLKGNCPLPSHSSKSKPTAATVLGSRSRRLPCDCFRKSSGSWRDNKRSFSTPNRRS